MQPPIEIIDCNNRHYYSDVLNDLWEMRYRVAKRFNWSIPYIAEGLDKDAFDTDDTVYLVLLNDERRVIGCSRLNSTLRPHLLDTVFGEYCDIGEIPRSSQVWEFSRLFVDRDFMTLKDVVRNCYLLMSAVAELIVANGLEGVTWYTYMQNYQAALACWQSTYPIGRPTIHYPDKVIYIPAFSPIDEEGLARIKIRARHQGPVCRYKINEQDWLYGHDTNVLRRFIKETEDAA